MSRRPPYENETQARDARLDRPPGRLRYKARGHVTMHAATGEVQVTPREMRQLRTFKWLMSIARPPGFGSDARMGILGFSR